MRSLVRNFSLALLFWLTLSLVQSKYYLVETEDDTKGDYEAEGEAEAEKSEYAGVLLTEEELDRVLDALPKKYKKSYNKANSTFQVRIRKKLGSAYGHDLDKMVKSAKDGSMEKLFGGDDYYAIGANWKPGGGGGCCCFSGSSTVETERGKIAIGNLRLGDNVLTLTPGTGAHYTEFLGWLDRDANADGKFLKISTNSSSIVLTGNHLVFRLSAEVGLESVFADQIEEGDRMVSWKGEETVVEVEVAREKGIWTPLTMEGTLLVDGLLASSYASFSHHVSELVWAPVKMFPRLLLDDQESQHQDGCRHVTKLIKKLGTATGFRERNQAKKEKEKGFSAKLAASAGFSKPVEL